MSTTTDTEVRTLSQWRRARLLTLRELASKTGLSYVTLSRIANGAQTPGFDTTKRLASTLDVQPEQIAECRVVMGLEDGR